MTTLGSNSVLFFRILDYAHRVFKYLFLFYSFKRINQNKVHGYSTPTPVSVNSAYYLYEVYLNICVYEN
jgi:hypothetical protein